ncbi:hypothetical protein [Actinoplanes xinjiangensis]|uniref:hypothetical protein n=1 Tax=Actinoplanes xinjiangensis TaxID=512350 RepID=UPI003416F57C
MRNDTSTDTVALARAEALFVSDMPGMTHPEPADIAEAIRVAFRRYGGAHACAAEMAAAFGDYPETSARRMTWARDQIDRLHPHSEVP